ncbi:flagellar motor protein MotB [Conexibacter sp. JD483]|uniref:OmpA/MotB family protein n=1 Tax=unclassified Conexibacter TaxID=2627773 RepID=UPI00271945E6|nr:MULTISPECIES: flagellar motor protein MotB [unclassified Conexibacter]MDO8188203.1 flagellar motor protein MotB [Conexibacter sp. CPCC 205706]MDO8201833.1 flagellar motor protein MotB [Conexibacter sp. CPCC 205762]MDR9372892.1 flagellar motor protein MotB [Conexibacter sp. JD483]
MSAARGGGRRRRRGGGGHGDDERWLLTYADMITLLLALFVVLYAISSVNVSKFRTLQDSLRDAFNGNVVNGGTSIMETGRSATRETPDSVIPNITPPTPQLASPRNREQAAALEARREEQEFQRIKHQIEQYARAHGLGNQVEAVIARRGLVVRLLTDRVLFDSGQAVLKTAGMPLLGHVGNLLNIDRIHPILVEGHTDDVPINTPQYHSNWELSTARATEVVRYLIGRGVPDRRFGASGYAELHPIGPNSTEQGRARNRRVEVVLQRLHAPPTTTTNSTAADDSEEGLTP